MGEDISELEWKWRRDYEKLDDDYDALRAYFDKHRKCSCEIDECKHFELAADRVLSERMDELMQRVVINGMIAWGMRIE